jgi:hypothetical protein
MIPSDFLVLRPFRDPESCNCGIVLGRWGGASPRSDAMSTISSLVVVLLVIARAIVIATVCTCNQYQRAAVFFLGRYSRRFLEWRRA